MIADSEKNTKDPSLIDYLGSVTIDPAVLDLAQKGHAKYATLNGRDLNDQVNLKNKWSAGGARSSDWIEKTFAETEDTIMQRFRSIHAPLTWTVDQINEAYNQVKQQTVRGNNDHVKFTIVEGMDVGRLQFASVGQLSILQVASQFNYLESPGTHIVPVKQYIYDHTQGPLASIEAAAAAIHRRVAVESGSLPNALCDIITHNFCQERNFYQNGYLQILEADVTKRCQLLNEITERVGHLRILPQWVKCEISGAHMLQVFAAAPSFQGYIPPANGSVEAAICRSLVVPQYEAIAKLAVIRSVAIGKPVPLHLTLVGQGAGSPHP
jgi:hypothetical protein